MLTQLGRLALLWLVAIAIGAGLVVVAIETWIPGPWWGP